ncbi:MAG: gliding motility-associated C-terminal domain-containing protein, partial [Bacteroidota bacterium]
NVDAGVDTVQCGEQLINLQASGGIDYLWSPASGLTNVGIPNPGANPDTSTRYFVQGTDTNGCRNLDSVWVRAWKADAGPDLNVCIGDTTQLMATDALSYQWDPSASILNLTSPNSPVFTLVDQAFFLTATDTSGCTDRDTVRVQVNPLPTTSTFGSDPYVCSGGGTVVTATGGDQYQWSPAPIFDDPSLASPVASPTYSGLALDSTWRLYVMVTDSNGCSSLDSLDQVVRLLPLISVSNDTTKCPGDTISLSTTGGVQYQWTPLSDLVGGTGPTVQVYTDSTTTYQAKVTAVWGCADSLPVTVRVMAPDAGSDTLICKGDSIELLATGGIAYSWSPLASLMNSNQANPLAFPADTTTFTVTATDAFGCTRSDQVTIYVPPLPPVDAGVNQAICIGDTAQLSAAGGGSILWLNPDSLSSDTLSTPLAWPRQTTDYVIQVSDTLGCSAQDSIRLTVNPLPLADAGPDTTTKCGKSPIQLQATGGIMYQWFNQGDLSALNISDPWAGPDSATTFYVSVADTNGCVNLDSIHVLTMYAQAGPSDTICFGDTVVLGANHLGGQAVSYQWSPVSSIFNSQVAQPLAFPPLDTDYVVVVTDSSGCSDTAVQRVVVWPLPPADAGEDEAICQGDSIQLQARGGSTYRWSPGSGLNQPTLPNPWAQPSVSTRYRVQVEDLNGCQDTASLLITVHPLPVVIAGPDTGVCQGQPVFLSVTGASNYVWTPGASLSDSLSAEPLAIPPVSTTYQVVGTDENGCRNSASLNIEVDILPTLKVPTDTAICLGRDLRLEATGAVAYQWSNGQRGPMVHVSPTQTTQLYVLPVGANGCVGDTSFIEVMVEENLPLAAFEPSVQEGYAPLLVGFENQSFHATRFAWDFGDGSFTTEAQPFHQYQQPGDYEVRLTADNYLDCPSEFSFRFIRILDFNMFIPNVFSPNNDGRNDEFTFVMNSIEWVEIAIYNRWGREIARSNQVNFAWDGRLSNGRLAAEGVYTYTLRARSFSGQEINRQGTLTLVK